MYIVNACNGGFVERFRRAARAYRAYEGYARSGVPVYLSDSRFADGDAEIASSGYGSAYQPETAARAAFFRALNA